MNVSEEVLKCEKQILERLNAEDDLDEESILEQFDWETVEPALIRLLLSEHDNKAYELAAWIVWDALLDNKSIKDDILIALLHLRLNTEQNPYDDNTVWSVTSRTYGLSYDCSEYNPFHDLRLEMKLNKYDLSFRGKEALKKDACNGCPVIADYSKPSKCPGCGKDNLITVYEGIDLISECTNCGWSVVGSGFYPNCSNDETRYTVRISKEKYTNKQIIKLAKMFEESTVNMYEKSHSAYDLEIVKTYYDALNIMEQCWEIGIACCIDPMPPYCQFGKCNNTIRKG